MACDEATARAAPVFARGLGTLRGPVVGGQGVAWRAAGELGPGYGLCRGSARRWGAGGQNLELANRAFMFI